MPKTSMTALLILVFCIGGSTQGAVEPAARVQAVSGNVVSNALGDDAARFDQLLDDAVTKNDVSFLGVVLDDDVRFTHGTGTIWSKQQWLKAAPQGKFVSRQVSAVVVERHGDLIETAGHIVTMLSGVSPVERQIDYVRLYVHRRAGWRLLSHRSVRETETSSATPPRR